METRDVQRIEQLRTGHPELDRLWAEHRDLETQIDRLNALRTLTPEEALRRQDLKKRKLAGMDRIQRILDGTA